MDITLLKIIKCKWCQQIFFVCHSCWRGQVYCCKKCRQAAQRKAHRRRQKKYRQTKKGKEAHRRQEKNRRIRNSENTVDDATSTPVNKHYITPEEQLFNTPLCRFCGEQGQSVDHFPKRGYEGRYADTNLTQYNLKGG